MNISNVGLLERRRTANKECPIRNRHKNDVSPMNMHAMLEINEH